MSKTVKSQWDFGELFPVEQTRKVLTVAELTTQVRRLLEQNVGQVWVTGEITNFRAQSSGHLYFTLKDAWAQVNCVLFKNEPVGDRSLLRDGQKVVMRGEMTVYEPRGQYQLRVMAIELQGVGALQVAFEKLKARLQAEGLFASERKRPLPRFPQRIGLVTSPTGAAIRDVLHVIKRRNPSLEIIFAACKVQGDGAAHDIASAIRRLNEFHLTGRAPIDLLLVTRGGGSLEDLWAFNEEIVARAIFDSHIPVVSGVGHEIDFTISDFVADVRAATPSAAAEIITEGVFSKCRFVSDAATILRQKVSQRVARENRNLKNWSDRLARAHPRRRLNEKLQRLDDLQTNLARCAHHDIRKYLFAWKNLQERLARVHPSRLLKLRAELFEGERRRLLEKVRSRFRQMQHRFATAENRLRLLSPEQVLARGYSITTDAATGKVLRSSDEARPGQKLRTKLKSGELRSTVD